MKTWEDGFESGVFFCVHELLELYDEPTIAAEMIQAAKPNLRNCAKADRQRMKKFMEEIGFLRTKTCTSQVFE